MPCWMGDIIVNNTEKTYSTKTYHVITVTFMMLSLPQMLVPIKMIAFTMYYSKQDTENFVPICNSNTLRCPKYHFAIAIGRCYVIVILTYEDCQLTRKFGVQVGVNSE